MDTTDKYHVYSGFHLGLQVAESILNAALGNRREDVLKELRNFSVGDRPADAKIVQRFPLAQGDADFDLGVHPVLARAATVVLDWINERA